MTKVSVFKKSFEIPEGFIESDKHVNSTLERVTFKNKKGDSFMIKVSSDTDFPFDSPYIKSKRDKTVNGITGKLLYYEPAGTERFVYVDENELLVIIDSIDLLFSNDVYDIVVC